MCNYSPTRFVAGLKVSDYPTVDESGTFGEFTFIE
jgi:hypothetical protein